MAEILTADSDLDEIRETIGLGQAELPNAALRRGSMLDACEIVLKRAVPKWEDLDDDDMVMFRKALIHYVAYALYPRLPMLVAEVESDSKSIFQRFKNTKLEYLAAVHFGLFKKSLSQISSYTSATAVEKLVTAVTPTFDPITGEGA